MPEYNYTDFDLKREEPPFIAFRKQLHVGERAPDFELHRLGAQPLRLRDLWKTGAAVLEFGSFT